MNSTSRTAGLRAFVVAAPLAFAALLTQHSLSTGDFLAEVSGGHTAWMLVHYGGAVLFPLMALVVWLLIRDLSGRAATLARCALPVFAVFYGVYEAIFGIATGILAGTAGDLGGAGARAWPRASTTFVSSPIVGEPGLFVSVGSIAWWVGIAAAIMALERAGASRPALVLLAVGGLLTFHVPIGPLALVCLSAAAFLVERRRRLPQVGAAVW